MARVTRLHLIPLGAVLLLVLFFILRSFLGGDSLSAEQRLLGLVDRMAAAAEERELSVLRRHIAPTYRDARGQTYEELNQYLTLLLLRQQMVTVTVLKKNVTVDHQASPRRAKLEVMAILTRGPRAKSWTDVLPDSARALSFSLELEEHEDVWRVTWAAWTDIPNVRELLK